jgi:hypothetical protein
MKLRVILLAIALGWGGPIAVAEDAAAPAAPAQAIPESVRQIDVKLRAVDQEEAQCLEELRELRRAATDTDRAWQSLLGQINLIRLQQDDLSQKVKDQKKVADEAEAKRQAATTRADAAKQKLADSQKEIEATKKEADEAAKQKLAEFQKEIDGAQKEANDSAEAAKKAGEMIAELDKKLAELPPKIDPLQAKVGDAEKAAVESRGKVEALEAKAAEFPKTRSTLSAQAEAELKAAGQWVSFTEQIAPIFHQHCVACHNRRNAQGRYNMADYRSILSVGESGEAILPGDAAASHLVEMIESGEMPYESDPLPPDQVELVKRWVDLGARIESAADRSAPLIRLMPRLPQPAAPQAYPAPLAVTGIAVDPTPRGLLATSGYHEILLWAPDKSDAPRRIGNVAQRVYGLDFHADGKRLAVASGTPGRLGEVKLFDVDSGELLSNLLVTEDVMFDVAFSPDGNRLAACGADGSIAIFDLTKSDPPRIIQDHADWVNSIAWSPDGKWLVSASRDKSAKVFNAETLELHITFGGHGQDVNAAIFLADSKSLASAGNDRKVRFWKVEDAKQTAEANGPGEEVGGLRLLADGRVVAVGSTNRGKIYTSADGKEVGEFELPAEWFTSLAVAPSGLWFAGNQQGDLIEFEAKEGVKPKRNWKAIP